MSVVGVGMDLVDVTEFATLLAEPASAFSERVFTEGERSRAATLPDTRRDQHLAARFAAKEAFVKAWSAALAGAPVPDGAPEQTGVWRGVEIVTDPFGRPSLRLLEPVSGAVEASIGEVDVLVSLTHERAMAGAVVVLSRRGEQAA